MTSSPRRTTMDRDKLIKSVLRQRPIANGRGHDLSRAGQELVKLSAFADRVNFLVGEAVSAGGFFWGGATQRHFLFHPGPPSSLPLPHLRRLERIRRPLTRSLPRWSPRQVSVFLWRQWLQERAHQPHDKREYMSLTGGGHGIETSTDTGKERLFSDIPVDREVILRST